MGMKEGHIKMKIGFIGTGVMGTGIIRNLLKGNEINIYTRTKYKAEPLINEGAHWVESPMELVDGVETIISMVGYPQDVEEVYFGDNGIFQADVKNKILVDMTTSTPTLAKRIGEEAHRKDALALDAPVSGGDIGAKNGTLTVMAGGDQEAFEKLADVFDQISQRKHLFGGFGTGQHAKMANQIMIAGTMTGLTEMLVYAKAANLNLPDVLATLQSGGADNWSMNTYVPRILVGDYTPGFFAKHFLKDLRIALDEAEKMNLDLPATKLATKLYEELVETKKLGNDGTQALVKLWW